jgi:acyl dehydratase
MTLTTGETVLDWTTPGCTPQQLARFSAGTEDPNPIHVDAEFARRAGFPAVLQQGPMTTAYFAHHLRARFGDKLRALDIAFTGPVFVGEKLRLTATVAETGAETKLTLAAAKLDGTPTAKGVATVAA